MYTNRKYIAKNEHAHGCVVPQSKPSTISRRQNLTIGTVPFPTPAFRSGNTAVGVPKVVTPYPELNGTNSSDINGIKPHVAARIRPDGVKKYYLSHGTKRELSPPEEVT